MLLIILSAICFVLTIGIAFSFGSADAALFDFENLNFSNMIPVLMLGGFISCVVVGITVIFIARSMFYKVKNYLSQDNKNGGDKK